MRKILAIGGLILIVLNLTGCKSFGLFKSNDEKAKDLGRSVIKLVEDGDEENLQELFSEKALEDCTDFETGFEYARSIYSGTYENIKIVGYNESSHYDKGKHSHEVRAKYEVETSSSTYLLYLYYWSSNTINPSEKGIYSMILSVNDSEKSYSQYAGIYNPNWDVEDS